MLLIDQFYSLLCRSY